MKKLENKYFVFYSDYFRGRHIEIFENYEEAMKFLEDLNNPYNNITKIIMIEGRELK